MYHPLEYAFLVPSHTFSQSYKKNNKVRGGTTSLVELTTTSGTDTKKHS